MECLAEMKKRPKFIDAIEKFQLSGAYPVFFAILCTISGLGNKYVYLPIISILALAILFSVLFVRDNKVFITPIFMIYYSMGTDNAQAFATSNGDVLAAFDSDGFAGICILAAIITIPFIVRLIADGSFAIAFKKRSFLSYGLLALDISILLGGAFSDRWTFESFIYSLIIIAGLNLFYIILSSIIQRSDSKIIPYACQIFVFACLIISAQVIVTAIKAHSAGDLIYYEASMDRWLIQRLNFFFSWGIPTIVGAITSLGIPAALYLAKNKRFPLFYHACAILFFAISIIVNTRSALIVGGLFWIVGVVIIIFVGKNKKFNLFFLLSLLSVFLGGVLLFACIQGKEVLIEFFWEFGKTLRFDLISDRVLLYQKGIDDFFISPIFGVGFAKGVSHSGNISNNFFSNMYHCLVIQMGVSAGIAGLIALIIHVKDIFILGIKKFSIDRLFILSVPIMILCMSMVDNFFFYLNFQIPYVAFLILAQKHMEK